MLVWGHFFHSHSVALQGLFYCVRDLLCCIKARSLNSEVGPSMLPPSRGSESPQGWLRFKPLEMGEPDLHPSHAVEFIRRTGYDYYTLESIDETLSCPVVSCDYPLSFPSRSPSPPVQQPSRRTHPIDQLCHHPPVLPKLPVRLVRQVPDMPARPPPNYPRNAPTRTRSPSDPTRQLTRRVLFGMRVAWAEGRMERASREGVPGGRD